MKSAVFAIAIVVGAIVLSGPSIGSSIHAFSQDRITVTIDGKPVQFTLMQPQMKKGKVYVPVRGVFEALGATVHYTSKTKLVRMTKQNESIELRIGNKMANKNGAEIEMDAVPWLRNGRAMIPLRFLAESLRADVKWNGATNTVELSTTPPDEDPPDTTGG